MARMLRWSPPLGGCPAQRWSPPLVRLPVAEVVASAGEPLGVEVVIAAGELLVQRWSPPLASRSELATTRPYWCGGSSYL
jgi:hypothetical protein